MPESEKDRNREYEDNYQRAWEAWGPLHNQCKLDHKTYLVNAFTQDDLRKFERLGIDALTFPLIRKNVKLIANMQRRGRLGFRFDPVEGQDAVVAQQLTAGITWCMARNQGYRVISEAFEGALKTRINLVDAYMDQDWNVRLKRYPYTSFVLDPGFQERDLSDCSYGIIRRQIAKTEAQKLLGGKERSVARIFNTTKLDDSKFPLMNREKAYGDHLMFYDCWQRRKSVERKYIIQTVVLPGPNGRPIGLQTYLTDKYGNRQVFRGSKDRLERLKAIDPTIDTITKWEETVQVTGYLNGVEIFNEEDPWGIGDLSFTPLIAFFDPEYTDAKFKMQSLTSILSDSQRMSDKMMNYILALLQLQAWGGMDVEVDALKDMDQAFMGGPFPRIFSEGAIAEGKYRDRPAADVPPGILEAWRMTPEFMERMANLNPEAFGMGSDRESRVSGLLVKLRQGAGLVGVFDFMDNLSMSQSMIGMKVLKFMQLWPRDVWKMILGSEPAPGIFNRTASKYDCICSENPLTDTQRNLFYQELLQLKQMGASMQDPAPINWATIMEYAPVAFKDKLMQAAKQAELAKQQAMQKQQQLAEAVQRLAIEREKATIESEKAQNIQRMAQAVEDQTDSALNRVETAQKIDELKQNQGIEYLKLAVDLEKARMQAQNKEAPAT